MVLEEKIVLVSVDHVALEHFCPKIDVLEIYAKLGGIFNELNLVPVDDCSLAGVFTLLATFFMPFLIILDGGSEYLFNLDLGYLRLLVQGSVLGDIR